MLTAPGYFLPEVLYFPVFLHPLADAPLLYLSLVSMQIPGFPAGPERVGRYSLKPLLWKYLVAFPRRPCPERQVDTVPIAKFLHPRSNRFPITSPDTPETSSEPVGTASQNCSQLQVVLAKMQGLPKIQMWLLVNYCPQSSESKCFSSLSPWKCSPVSQKH